MPSSIRVVVASDLNLRHSSEIYRGVVDFCARRQLGWQLLPLGYDFETRVTELLAAGAIEGVIGTFVSDRWLAELVEAGVRAVNLFRLSEIRTVPTVGIDDRAIGAAAAAHLVQQGARSFAFVGRRGGFDHHERHGGFRSALAACNAGWCDGLVTLETGPRMQGQLDLLRFAERPVGVFCSSDRQAREFLTHVRAAGLGEPGVDWLVVGVDDDPAESIFIGTGLSSFAIPAHACGWHAAERLARQLDGQAVSLEFYPVEGWRLIARDSSLRPGSPRLAERVAAHLRNNLENETITMDEVARSLGSSRRTLEIAFRAHFELSPYRWLVEQRIEKAAELLTNTDLRIQEIALRCGFARQHHFSASFRQHRGTSPRVFRQRSRKGTAHWQSDA